jgi:group I intron endonuclease
MTNGKMTCNIYKLINKINGKVYIGQTWLTFDKRMGKDGIGYKNSHHLYSAICKYGSENFEYSILDECADQETADKLEDQYIEQYNSKNPDIGYNLKDGGSHGRHSEESKQKISQALMGREVSEETREKISKIHAGIPKPPHTEEWKHQNSEFMIQRHQEQGHPMQGKLHTEESKQAMSDKLVGRKQSDETIEKRIKSRMLPQEIQNQIIQAYLDGATINQIKKQFNIGGNGKIYRILERNNISLLNNYTKWAGKRHSEKTKDKMSEARSQYWDQKKEP